MRFIVIFVCKSETVPLCTTFVCFYFNRDALNLLKTSPVPKATPVMTVPASPAAPTAPSPVPTTAAAPPPPGSRPNIPPLSVPGKPGGPVSVFQIIPFISPPTVSVMW